MSRANTAHADVQLKFVATHGITMRVAVGGSGPAVLLLHGWPYTWFLWRKLIPALIARGHRVIAPDLRGIGETSRPAGNYDLYTQADDLTGLLDALGVEQAATLGFDFSTGVAWMLAMRQPARVTQLVVMEGLIGSLPGAEDFLKAGPPWWFGFHGAPGLAESVLVGHEAEYLGWFYANQTVQPLDPVAQATYIQAYTGVDALRGGFEHYRVAATNNAQIREMVQAGRLRQPTLAVGGGVVKAATYQQLSGIADQLTGHLVKDCGHVIPEEQPEALFELLDAFFPPV